MLLYGGKDRKFAADSKRIYKQLAKYHDDADAPVGESLPSIVQFGPDRELQGSELLKQAGRKGEDLMIRFLKQHSVEPDYEWSQRRS